MAGEGFPIYLCAKCEGSVRETTGFWRGPSKTYRNSRRGDCCHGQPLRRCADQRLYVAGGTWLASAVESWLQKTEFVSALDRNPGLDANEIRKLRYRLSKAFVKGVEHGAFGRTIYELQHGLTSLGDYARRTGAPPSERVVKFAIAWEKRRSETRQSVRSA